MRDSEAQRKELGGEQDPVLEKKDPLAIVIMHRAALWPVRPAERRPIRVQRCYPVGPVPL